MKPAHRSAPIASLAAFVAGCLLVVLTPALTPLEKLDAALTRLTAGLGRFETGGTGARDNPRVVIGVTNAPEHPPVRYAAINNDPLGIFETSPPSPSDMLVIFRNLKQLGHRSLALAIPMAWDTPDPIALAAVDAELANFGHTVVGAPLQNGITPQPLPPAFVRASLPLSAVHGPAGALPIVNGVAIPHLITGLEKTLAGFSSLESEAKATAGNHDTVTSALLARWNDRVVLSFPLLVAMTRAEANIDTLEIIPGKHIRLGDHGPIIPIDIHGQAVFHAHADDNTSTPADALIRDDPKAPVPAGLQPGPGPLVVRDERGGHEPEAVELGNVIAGILNAQHARGARTLTRLPLSAEITLLAWCALLCGISLRWQRHILWRLSLVAIGFAFPYACILLAGYWTAPLALAVVFLAAPACAAVMRRKSSVPPPPDVTPAKPDHSEPRTSPIPAKPARKSSRKKPPRKKKRP